MINKSHVCFIVSILLLSCNSDDDTAKEVCGDSIIVNAALYQQESPSEFNILNAEINEDCLFITIVGGGCDMSTWQADLITDGLQTDAIPPTRLIRLNFVSLESCEVAFMKTYEFYLGDEAQTVIYSLDDWEEELIHNE